jgi:hypothetical protein
MVGALRLKITHLLQWYMDIPPEHRNDIESGIIISKGVIDHFLGDGWLRSKISPKR